MLYTHVMAGGARGVLGVVSPLDRGAGGRTPRFDRSQPAIGGGWPRPDRNRKRSAARTGPTPPTVVSHRRPCGPWFGIIRSRLPLPWAWGSVRRGSRGWRHRPPPTPPRTVGGKERSAPRSAAGGCGSPRVRFPPLPLSAGWRTHGLRPLLRPRAAGGYGAGAAGGFAGAGSRGFRGRSAGRSVPRRGPRQEVAGARGSGFRRSQRVADARAAPVASPAGRGRVRTASGLAPRTPRSVAEEASAPVALLAACLHGRGVKSTPLQHRSQTTERRRGRGRKRKGLLPGGAPVRSPAATALASSAASSCNGRAALEGSGLQSQRRPPSVARGNRLLARTPMTKEGASAKRRPHSVARGTRPRTPAIQ